MQNLSAGCTSNASVFLVNMCLQSRVPKYEVIIPSDWVPFLKIFFKVIISDFVRTQKHFVITSYLPCIKISGDI